MRLHIILARVSGMPLPSPEIEGGVAPRSCRVGLDPSPFSSLSPLIAVAREVSSPSNSRMSYRSTLLFLKDYCQARSGIDSLSVDSEGVVVGGGGGVFGVAVGVWAMSRAFAVLCRLLPAI